MKRHLLLSLLAVVAFTLPLRAQAKMSDDGKRAAGKALDWLASKQNEDGSFSEGPYVHNTAITGFAMLAFMSQGHLPNQGQHGPEVAKAARFLMGAKRQDGYIVGARGGNMYCHGMATLALAELWGQTQNDDELKKVVQDATELIVRCQSPEGGWRYNPVNSQGADISVTIMQVMALRAAKNAGLNVPDKNMKDAISYIKRCYLDKQGGFTYQPNSGAPGFARTAAGACVLFLSGEYKAQEIPKAVEYLKKHFDESQHYFYGHYYAAHAMHQVGGKDWKDWYAKLNATFLPMQSADGSWSRVERGSPGPVYQTAIAVIALSVPMNYLPIFQR